MVSSIHIFGVHFKIEAERNNFKPTIDLPFLCVSQLEEEVSSSHMGLVGLGEYIHQRCLVNLGIWDQLSDVTQFTQGALELEKYSYIIWNFIFIFLAIVSVRMG